MKGISSPSNIRNGRPSSATMASIPEKEPQDQSRLSFSRRVGFPDPLAKSLVDPRLPATSARSKMIDHVLRQPNSGGHFRSGEGWTPAADGGPGKLFRPAVRGQVRRSVRIKISGYRASFRVHWLSSCFGSIKNVHGLHVALRPSSWRQTRSSPVRLRRGGHLQCRLQGQCSSRPIQ